jgi:hypothetical protein
MGALMMGDASALAPADFVAAFDGVLTVLDRLRVSGSTALIDPPALVDDVARAAAATLERHATRLSEPDYRRAVDRLRLTSPVVAAALPRSGISLHYAENSAGPPRIGRRRGDHESDVDRRAVVGVRDRSGVSRRAFFCVKPSRACVRSAMTRGN